MLTKLRSIFHGFHNHLKQCLLFDHKLKHISVVRAVFKYNQSASTNSVVFVHLNLVIIIQIWLFIIRIEEVLTQDIVADRLRHFRPKVLLPRKMRVQSGLYVSHFLEEGLFADVSQLLVLLRSSVCSFRCELYLDVRNEV